MKNKHIIKKNFEFQEIIGLQQKVMNSSFVICSRPADQAYLRYGISVGKKLAKAHQRNRVKRQIRVIMYDFLKKEEIPHKDIIVMVRPNYLKNSFQVNQQLLTQLLHKLGKRYNQKSIGA